MTMLHARREAARDPAQKAEILAALVSAAFTLEEEAKELLDAVLDIALAE
jgi:hypothetical protein